MQQPICIILSSFTWPEIISISASIATCISAAIALVALWQIKKQRESSYHPELFLAIRPSISAVIKPNNEEHASIHYRQFVNDKPTDLIGMLFSIENIGFGAAKEVKVEWNFDHAKALNKVIKHNPGADTLVLSDGYLEIKNKKDETFAASWCGWDEVGPTVYDFVLPRSQEKFNLAPNVPTEATDLFVAYAILRMNILNHKELSAFYREDFKKFPKLTAKLTYKDIGNKAYTKKFSIGFEISTGLIDPGVKFKDLKELELPIYHDIHQLD